MGRVKNNTVNFLVYILQMCMYVYMVAVGLKAMRVIVLLSGWIPGNIYYYWYSTLYTLSNRLATQEYSAKLSIGLPKYPWITLI